MNNGKVWSSGLSRRTVVSTSAWVMPVVLMAQAAPAMATSTDTCSAAIGVGLTIDGVSEWHVKQGAVVPVVISFTWVSSETTPLTRNQFTLTLPPQIQGSLPAGDPTLLPSDLAAGWSIAATSGTWVITYVGPTEEQVTYSLDIACFWSDSAGTAVTSSVEVTQTDGCGNDSLAGVSLFVDPV
jgi:hypothetical protein